MATTQLPMLNPLSSELDDKKVLVNMNASLEKIYKALSGTVSSSINKNVNLSSKVQEKSFKLNDLFRSSDSLFGGKHEIMGSSSAEFQKKPSLIKDIGLGIMDALTGKVTLPKKETTESKGTKETKIKQKEESEQFSSTIVSKLEEIRQLLEKSLFFRDRNTVKRSPTFIPKSVQTILGPDGKPLERSQPKFDVGMLKPTSQSFTPQTKVSTNIQEPQPQPELSEKTNNSTIPDIVYTDRSKQEGPKKDGWGKKVGRFLSKTGKVLGAGIGGIAGGIALNYASDKLIESGNEKLGGVAGVGSSAATGAGIGATIGSVVPGVGTAIGAGVGAAAGGAYGLYKNWKNIFGKKTNDTAAGSAAETAQIPKEQIEALSTAKFESSSAERQLRQFEEKYGQPTYEGNIESGQSRVPYKDAKVEKEWSELISKASSSGTKVEELTKAARTSLTPGAVKSKIHSESFTDMINAKKYFQNKGISLNKFKSSEEMVAAYKSETDAEIETKVYKHDINKLERSDQGDKASKSWFKFEPESEATKKYHAARKGIEIPKQGDLIDRTSVENQDMSRSIQPAAATAPIVSNNVISTNSQNFVPVKATARLESSFSRYMEKTASFA